MENCWDGTGTVETPYLIQSVEDLLKFAEAVNSGISYAGTHFLLTADLDLDGTAWPPIGVPARECAFSGRFDGGGHTIRGVSVSTEKTDCGFFGQVTGVSRAERAEVANLTVSGTIRGKKVVGGIVGFLRGADVFGCAFSGTVTGDTVVGGIVGAVIGGIVSRCQVQGDISGRYAGGIGGQGKYSTISNSYFLGNVATPQTYAGGIGGNLTGMTLEYCYAAGTVSGDNYVGGIAGFTEQGRWKGILSLMQSVSCPYPMCGRIAGMIRRVTTLGCLAWMGMKNPEGRFAQYVTNNGGDISYYLLWNGFEKKVGPWKGWNPAIWKIDPAFSSYRLPVLMWQEQEPEGDFSYLAVDLHKMDAKKTL
ncbi:MAG: hypothetical protein O0X96_09485 [Methanocorpusculum sp.]|nr:hypothetical protein [Methanocorpusculum sp.]